MDSILTSIKKMLGISEEYEHFDPEIIMHINTVFMGLTQIGVGVAEGYMIASKDDKWSDFLPTDKLIEAVKSYTYLKVKLIFDPPSSSTIIESYNRLLSEFEWRINVAVDTYAITSSGVKLDYNLLENKPSINGETLVGNYDEKDPTAVEMLGDISTVLSYISENTEEAVELQNNYIGGDPE
jgi:hypothetical protein